MGQHGELGKSDAGKRQHLFGADRSALDAAQHEGGERAGGSGFVHHAPGRLLDVIAQPRRRRRKTQPW